MKPALWALAFAPIGYIAFQIYLLATGSPHALGGEPGAAVMRLLGNTAWWALILVLAITPLRQWWPALTPLVRARRLVGLWVSAYVILHLLAYYLLVLGMDVSVLWDDISQKPYAIAGFAATLGLIPLTVTSTRGWMRRLGRDWKRLHRIVYGVAFAAWIHVVWQVRSDYTEAVVFGLILLVLALLRAPTLRLHIHQLFLRN